MSLLCRSQKRIEKELILEGAGMEGEDVADRSEVVELELEMAGS